MPILTLSSPAKINLFLHILGKRTDGYHNLQTIFQFLDYGDTLTFSDNSSDQVDVESNLINIPKTDNLIIRAAELLRQATGCTNGCRIVLDKKIPMGAGLGGGSSNAATTLIALNILWECGLSATQISELGQTLGADIPIFLNGNSAFAEGIGEVLTPINLPEKWFLVITPSCHISTKEIFSHPELTRNSAPIKIRALPEGVRRNDCQKLVVKCYPEVREVLEWMSDFSNPLLTGTGASVFCSFDNQQEAQRVLQQAPKHWKAFVARGLNKSPVQQEVNNCFNGASPSG